jgi:hypothetical protein
MDGVLSCLNTNFTSHVMLLKASLLTKSCIQNGATLLSSLCQLVLYLVEFCVSCSMFTVISVKYLLCMPQPLVTQHFKCGVGHKNDCILDLTKQGQLFCVSHKDYPAWLVWHVDEISCQFIMLLVYCDKLFVPATHSWAPDLQSSLTRLFSCVLPYCWYSCW